MTLITGGYVHAAYPEPENYIRTQSKKEFMFMLKKIFGKETEPAAAAENIGADTETTAETENIGADTKPAAEPENTAESWIEAALAEMESAAGNEPAESAGEELSAENEADQAASNMQAASDTQAASEVQTPLETQTVSETSAAPASENSQIETPVETTADPGGTTADPGSAAGESADPGSTVEDPISAAAEPGKPKRNRKKSGILQKLFNILPESTGLSVVILIVLFIEAFFILIMSALDILPAKYAIAVLAALLLADLGTFKLLNCRKRMTNQRLIGLILTVVILNVLFIGSNYLYNTYDTFQKISEEKAQYEEFHVIVLKDGSYDKLRDIKDETVYVINSESKMYTEAKEKLKTKIDVELSEVTDNTEAGAKLVDGSRTSDNIIFVSNTNYELLCENNDKFEENTKILYSIPIAIKTNDFAKRINVTEDPFNIYITGMDVWGGIDQIARSDVNMVMTVNPQTKTILLTSIPRDSYVMLHSYGMSDKLTHSGIYGVEETVTTVEDWLGYDMNYYLRVNFEMLVDIINAIDGVDVYSDYAFKSSISDYTYTQGENHLDGMAALYFARERKSFEGEDMERGKNQQKVLTAMINKATQSKVILTRYTKLLDAVEGEMQTNMSNKDISALVKMQLSDMSGWTINSVSITGRDAYASTYSMGSQELAVVIPDDESVEAAKKAIHDTMYPAYTKSKDKKSGSDKK